MIMKRVLYIFMMLIVFATVSLGAKFGGVWIKTKGLKVYIPPKDMLTTPMTHAFQEWQRKTQNNFTFEFVNTKSTANIEVIFLDSGIAKMCGERALGCAVPRYKISYMGSRIINSKIFVSRRSFNNTVMINTEIYTIMLHEIGHSLGLGHSENKTSIMFKGTNRTLATKQEILDEDIQTLYKLYGF